MCRSRFAYVISLTKIHQVWLFGGESSGDKLIDSEIHFVDLSEAKPAWNTVDVAGTKPPPRIAHAQAVVGDSIYVHGGHAGNSHEPLGDLWHFDTLKSEWAEVSSASGSVAVEPRCFHMMAALGASLYVFGGCDAKDRLNDLCRFDIPTSTWASLPASSSIVARGGACFAASGDSLFVAAGYSGQEQGDIHTFSTAS